MYQSANAQLVQAKKASNVKKIISQDIDLMIRNQMLQQGLTPAMELDESVTDNRTEIMMVLRGITKQPKKVYSELFNRNELDEFLTVMDQFTRKYLKGRRNLTSNIFMLEWDKFKKNPNDKPFTIEETNRMTSITEDTEASKRRGIKNKQGSERNKLYEGFDKTKQEIATRDRRIKELFKKRNKGINDGSISYGDEQALDDEIAKLTREKKHFEELIKRVPIRESIQRQLIDEVENIEYNKLDDIQVQIDALNQQYRELGSMDKRKKEYKERLDELNQLKKDLLENELAGFGLKRQKKNVGLLKQVRVLIDPTKMSRKAFYPVGRNWSWM